MIGQIPRSGTLSAYDKVKLVVARPVNGVVPRLVGMPVESARARLARLKLHVRIAGGRHGRVVSQAPRWGVAAGPGMRVVLTVKQKTGG